MLLLENIEDYNNQFLILLPSVKNNLIANSLFTRIIYSPPMMAFNGLYLNIQCSKDNIIHTLSDIENDILSKYHCSKKKKNYVKTVFKYKIPPSSSFVILKISGIWESETTYGLAYKLINPSV
jgi:hypothetical protein